MFENIEIEVSTVFINCREIVQIEYEKLDLSDNKFDYVNTTCKPYLTKIIMSNGDKFHLCLSYSDLNNLSCHNDGVHLIIIRCGDENAEEWYTRDFISNTLSDAISIAESMTIKKSLLAIKY